MNKSDQPTRWHAARLPDPVITKRRPLWQFSLWDLCCVMALTGLATGLNVWSYQHGHTWEFAFLIWSIIATGLVFTLNGRLIRAIVVILLLCGVCMLAVNWYFGLKAAIRYEIISSPTYRGDEK
jgi:hypothetical protein